MDAMAHLNNVQYFRLIEEARIRWVEAFGFPTLPSGEAPILAHASLDFTKAMNYPATAGCARRSRGSAAAASRWRSR